MKRRITIGQLDELRITVEPSAAVGFVVLSVILAQVARRMFQMRPSQAIVSGLLGATLHMFSEFWHQLGHARAARRTGYPMRGIHFFTILAASRYPRDEGELPPDIHITRALGGPQASLLLTLLAGVLASLVRPLGGVWVFVTTFFALDNLLVFTIGALTPIPFFEDDGVTILRQLRRNKPQRIVLSE
jgi:Zn-dependent protease